MNELHETALHYARYGWHIIPLVPDKKIPLTTAGVLDASCDLAQIDAWWRQWPRANIGISAFASGFHIIDIDTKGGDGLAEWKELTSQHETPETACVRTPSGGWHLYYLNRVDSLPNRKLAKNIDTRGLNGYVVAPPSVVNGTAYAWHFTPEPSGVGIQLLPNWIREKLETKEQATPEANPQAFALSLPSAEVTNKANAYCLLAIERICSDIKNAPNGSRHVTYRDSAVRLVSLGLAKWHTVDFEPNEVFMSAVRQNSVPVTQKELDKYEERFIVSAEKKAEPAREPKWRQNNASFIPIGAEVTLKNGTRGTVRWFDKQSVRVGRETVSRSEVVAW